MTIECRLTVRDYLAAQRLHFRPKPMMRYVLWAAFALLVGMIVAQFISVAQGGPLPRYWWVLPAGLGYGAILFFIVLPMRVKKIFEQNPALATPSKISLTDEALLLETSRGNIQFKWPMLKKWKRNNVLILVYHSTMHFQIIPKHCFANAEGFENLAAMLRESLGEPQP